MAAKSAGRTTIASRPATPAASPAASGRRMPNLPDWRWRSFPVLAAFIAGLLVDSILNPPASDAAVVVRVVAVLGAGYCLAHLFIVNTIVARRIQARQKALATGETDEDEWVDEVVHPDENAGLAADQSRPEPDLRR